MQDPHRTAEDVAFAVARFFQYGGTLQNYYMVSVKPIPSTRELWWCLGFMILKIESG